MPRRTVCISHATGAGGRAVGRTVADRLGFRYVDEEVIAEAAEWADLDPSIVADAERRKPLVERMLGGPAEDGAPPEAEVRALIIEVLRAFAERGSVVIVSHAASFALADRADLDVLRVLVTASPATRARRVAAGGETSARDAERQIRKEDDARADYLQRFYGVAQELNTHYDVVLNTDVLTLDEAVGLIEGVAAA
ncbi:MAG: AAA family ATPase [Thermoleophilia bacterium]